jgi:hypothetical protein
MDLLYIILFPSGVEERREEEEEEDGKEGIYICIYIYI